MAEEKKSDIPDLIPDFDLEPQGPSPLDILRHQADLIERKTGGSVTAVVEAARSSTEKIAFELILSSPATAYRYKVLRIEFGIENWPVDVFLHGSGSLQSLDAETQYTSFLSNTFRSPEFKRVVAGLRSLADEEATFSAAEEEILGVFRAFNIGAGEYLPSNTLVLAIEKFPAPAREDAEASLRRLVQRGALTATRDGLGYTLTEKGSRLVYG